MILRSSMFCFVIGILQGPAIAEDKAKTYPIRLFRPAKVDDSYRLIAADSTKQLMIVSRNGKATRTNSTNTRVEFEAEVTILKVDDSGRVLKKSVVIERFVDGQKTELLKKGETVIAETIEGKTVYRLEKQPLPIAARKRLARIVETQTADRPDDDAIFGSMKDRAIGENWKVDPAAVARELKVDAKAVSGLVTLKARKTIDGFDSLQIAADINIRSFPNAKRLTDGGYKLVDPSVVAKLVGEFPIDAKNGSTGRSSKVTMKATLVGDKPQLKGVTIVISGEWTTSKHRIYRR